MSPTVSLSVMTITRHAVGTALWGISRRVTTDAISEWSWTSHHSEDHPHLPWLPSKPHHGENQCQPYFSVAWLKASVMGWSLLSGASDGSSSLPHTAVQPAWPKSRAPHHLTPAALLPIGLMLTFVNLWDTFKWTMIITHETKTVILPSETSESIFTYE